MKEPIIVSDHIKQLISGYLSDSSTPDELSALRVWIDESPAHKIFFNEIRDTWTLTGKDNRNNKSKEENLLELVEKMTRYNRGVQRSFWTWQRIAASWVIILIGAGALGWYMHGGHFSEPESIVVASTTIQAKMGSQSLVDMPDGTKVWLNGGSRLTYSNVYGQDDREVQLAGEGCFEVVTNPEKPFVVKAGGLSIRAYGTSFNVKAYPEDKAVTTTLVKGKVTIEGKDENNKTFSLEMRPNENVIYLTGRTEKKGMSPSAPNLGSTVQNNLPEPVVIENNIDPELYTSWKDDFWVIEKQKLGNLAKDFERRYDVRITFTSDEVANYHFSGTIQRETIEQVMRILRRTIPLKYTFDKNQITIDDDQTLMKEFHSKNK